MSSIDLIRGFQTMGCKDDLKCAVASLVYLDLKEDGTLINLEKLYDYELDVIYFLGQQENCARNIIVPTPSTEEIDMTKMEEIQSKLNAKANGFTIAICDPNSTILYYSMTSDFIEK